MNYNIIDMIVAIVGIFAIGVLIPTLKRMKTKTEWEQILINADIAVKAAEQIFDYQDNDKKFNYADNILKNMFKDKLSAEEREMVIESIVAGMNEFKNELVK